MIERSSFQNACLLSLMLAYQLAKSYFLETRMRLLQEKELNRAQIVQYSALCGKFQSQEIYHITYITGGRIYHSNSPQHALEKIRKSTYFLLGLAKVVCRAFLANSSFLAEHPAILAKNTVVTNHRHPRLAKKGLRKYS